LLVAQATKPMAISSDKNMDRFLLCIALASFRCFKQRIPFNLAKELLFQYA
jgi:hypothetical protein